MKRSVIFAVMIQLPKGEKIFTLSPLFIFNLDATAELMNTSG
jgi:hypothetical protein